MPEPIVVYTGAQVWQGRPEIRPSRKGRVEHGPGIYFTTSLETAKKYARGRGTVLRVEIDPNFVWLEDAIAPKADLIEWVRNQRGLRHKAEIIRDIAERGGRGLADDRMARVSTLVNLTRHYEAITGEHGPALARFLASMGIGADLVTPPLFGRRGDEQWLVLFDPSKVLGWERVGKQADFDLPRIRKNSRRRTSRRR